MQPAVIGGRLDTIQCLKKKSIVRESDAVGRKGVTFRYNLNNFPPRDT